MLRKVHTSKVHTQVCTGTRRLGALGTGLDTLPKCTLGTDLDTLPKFWVR